MVQSVQRNVVMLIGILLSAMVCVQAAPYLISPRGALGPSVLLAESPLRAGIVVLVCFGLATLVAAVVGRMINAVAGMFIIGAGMFALDGRLATIRAIATAHAGSMSRIPLILLAVEAIAWSAVVLAATLAVYRIAGPLRDIEPTETNQRPHPLTSGDALRSAISGVIVLIAVYFMGQSSMKGQMIGVIFLGSMLAGLMGRLVAPHVQPILIMISPVVFGAVGYVISMTMLKLPLDASFVADRLPKLLMPVPLDYVAGSLMGVTVGLGWARSFLHHEEAEPVTSTSAA